MFFKTYTAYCSFVRFNTHSKRAYLQQGAAPRSEPLLGTKLSANSLFRETAYHTPTPAREALSKLSVFPCSRWKLQSGRAMRRRRKEFTMLGEVLAGWPCWPAIQPRQQLADWISMSTTQTLNGGFQPRLKKPRACVQIALEQQTEIIAFVQQKSLVQLRCCRGQESHQYPLSRQKKQFPKKPLLMRGH